jgi:putative transposase
MKYRNKYRIDSARKKGFNYSSQGLYYVTINIRSHKCLFGEIEDREMKLSPLGDFAERYWLEIPEHFANVHLKDHVIMPNHVHGIIEIKKELDHYSKNH